MSHLSSYREGRDLIENGDILAFHTTAESPLGPKIVSLFTGYSIYHVGFAIWLYSTEGDRRLFIVEANKGNRQIIPLSLYAGERIDVFKCPVKFSKISSQMLDKIGYVKYSYFDLPIIWLRERFGIRLPNQQGEVCSEMIAKILEEADIRFENTLMSPGKLIEKLSQKGIELRISLDK